LWPQWLGIRRPPEAGSTATIEEREIQTGRRCRRMQLLMGEIAEGMADGLFS